MRHSALIAALGALPLAFATPMAAAQEASSGQSFSLPGSVSQSDLGNRELQTIAVQVMLDRANHSPGVIDGYTGGNTSRAIRAYRRANGLPEGDAIDSALIDSLRSSNSGSVFSTYTITQEDLSGGFTDVPSGFAEQADLERVGYEDAQEMLAERFHMDQEFLAALNPDADFSEAGQQIVVVDTGNGGISGEVARIEVRRDAGEVAALDAEGNVLATYPATIGSDEFPSPSGSMQVNAVAPEANYTFDPNDQEWGPDTTFVIPPGPNNPVGGIWIDLSKDGYGIHGSPDPQLIGKTQSHGCVRLTNWDAQELANAVSQGVEVEFV